jgi:release factor glutamine methyltransferase
VSETPGIDAGLSRAQALALVAEKLARAGIEEARGDARALLLSAAGLAHADFVLAPEAPLGAGAARLLAEFAARRAAREPVSRILGTRGFWTLDLGVAPGVLDPRADTETLVELTLELLRARRDDALSILDLGTGSGAILCALLTEFPRARAIAVDLSWSACAAATANLARCGVRERACVLRGRWAEAIASRFDLVVSNPPYVRAGDIAGLDPEVSRHDPALALDGGADGLDCYREIAHDLPRLLAANGVALFEIGADQREAVAALLTGAGLDIAATRRDSGGRERIVAARRAPSLP